MDVFSLMFSSRTLLAGGLFAVYRYSGKSFHWKFSSLKHLAEARDLSFAIPAPGPHKLPNELILGWDDLRHRS